MLKYFSFPYNLLFSHVFLFSTLDPRFLETSTSEVASEENNELVVAPRSSASWKCLPRCYLRSRLEVQSKLRTRVGKYVCVHWIRCWVPSGEVPSFASFMSYGFLSYRAWAMVITAASRTQNMDYYF